jgi:hypothetical protein
MSSFDPERIFERLQDGEWPHHPLYNSALQELLQARPSRLDEMAQRLGAYRKWCDTRRQADPAAITFQASGEAFQAELLDLVARPGTASLRRLLRVAQRLEKNKRKKHFSIPVLILLGTIYLREECQYNHIDRIKLRNLIEDYRQHRIEDSYWRKCLQRPALVRVLEFR